MASFRPRDSVIPAEQPEPFGVFKKVIGYGQEVPEIDKEKGYVPVYPYSPFAQVWETLSGVLLLYTTAVTPFLVAYYSEEEGFCNHPPTLEFDMLVDIFFLLEIPVHFLTGVVVRGEYQYLLAEVARHYARSSLTTDTLSAMPIAWLEKFMVPDNNCAERAQQEGGNSFIRYLRFIRMIRMLRLLKVLKIFNVLRDLFSLRPAVLRLLKAAFTLFMIAHVGGSLWWFLKTLYHKETLIEFRQEYDIEIPILSAYLVSFYYMMATLCTVGYGDIAAVGDWERLFAIVLMMLGASVFAIIVSNMSALAQSMQSQENVYLEHMDNVVDYLRMHAVDPNLEKHVQNFYHFKCRQKTSFSMGLTEILRELPFGLQRKIKLELNRKILGGTWIFDKLDDDLIARAVDKLEVQVFSPQEVIIYANAYLHGLCIVISGNVKVLLPHSEHSSAANVLETLGKGDVFGELALLMGTRSPYQVQAVDYVELYVMQAEDFDDLFPHGDELRTRLEDLAVERLRQFDGILRQQGDMWVDAWEGGGVLDRWEHLTRRLMLKSRQRTKKLQRDRTMNFSDRLTSYTLANTGHKSSVRSNGEIETASADDRGMLSAFSRSSSEHALSPDALSCEDPDSCSEKDHGGVNLRARGERVGPSNNILFRTESIQSNRSARSSHRGMFRAPSNVSNFGRSTSQRSINTRWKRGVGAMGFGESLPVATPQLSMTLEETVADPQLRLELLDLAQNIDKSVAILHSCLASLSSPAHNQNSPSHTQAVLQARRLTGTALGSLNASHAAARSRVLPTPNESEALREDGGTKQEQAHDPRSAPGSPRLSGIAERTTFRASRAAGSLRAARSQSPVARRTGSLSDHAVSGLVETPLAANTPGSTVPHPFPAMMTSMKKMLPVVPSPIGAASPESVYETTTGASSPRELDLAHLTAHADPYEVPLALDADTHPPAHHPAFAFTSRPPHHAPLAAINGAAVVPPAVSAQVVSPNTFPLPAPHPHPTPPLGAPDPDDFSQHSLHSQSHGGSGGKHSWTHSIKAHLGYTRTSTAKNGDGGGGGGAANGADGAGHA